MEGRVFLIHWNESEAETLAREIQDWGWEIAGVEAEDGYRGSKMVREMQPDVIVIHLSRLPSHGRETAAYLRSLKATHSLPIIFVGGKDEPLAKTREKVPDAIFVEPQELKAALKQLFTNSL